MQARNGVPHRITPNASPGPLPSRQANTPAACSHNVPISQRPVVAGFGRRKLTSTTPRAAARPKQGQNRRSEEHTSELQSLMRISYADICLTKRTNKHKKYMKQK